jgi:hypothetical protein
LAFDILISAFAEAEFVVADGSAVCPPLVFGAFTSFLSALAQEEASRARAARTNRKRGRVFAWPVDAECANAWPPVRCSS